MFGYNTIDNNADKPDITNINTKMIGCNINKNVFKKIPIIETYTIQPFLLKNKSAEICD